MYVGAAFTYQINNRIKGDFLMETRKHSKDFIVKYLRLYEIEESIIESLDARGFFIAPVSTKYHGAYEGGLADHSYEVADALQELTARLCLKWERSQSPIIVGIMHDLCKCDKYYIDETTGAYEYVEKDILS